jgi:hypothetical protein
MTLCGASIFRRLFVFLCLATLAGMFPRLAAAQGAMTNGANHPGTIGAAGQIDTWTFAANKGDGIAVSIGKTGGDSSFRPWIRVIGPDNSQIGGSSNGLAAEVDLTAPLSGTYTVLASSFVSGATGDYTLLFAKSPGAFVVSGGDEGGPMTNGANHAGIIPAGDLDMWSFTANKGDAIALSIGEVAVSEVDPGFAPWIRLFGPDGALINSRSGLLSAEIDAAAPLTGSYTVVVGSFSVNPEPGHYSLTFVKVPGAFVVPDGDEGGAVTNGWNHAGVIPTGDLDTWTFAAAKGDAIAVSVGEVFASEVDPGFSPWIRLFGPDGDLIDSRSGSLAAEIDQTAPLTGTYTVVVGSFSFNTGPGHYLLTVAKVPGAFQVPIGDEGGTLVNGGNHPGVIPTADLDLWTFDAKPGDSIAVSIAEAFVGEVDPGFNPWIRLFGPDGKLISSRSSTVSTEIDDTAQLTGTYTVVSEASRSMPLPVTTY